MGGQNPDRAGGRRRFLALLSSALLVPLVALPRRKRAEAETRTGSYVVDVKLLYGLFALRLDGKFTEVVDPAAGRYHAITEGRGDGIVSRVESSGLLRTGRWAPRETHAYFDVMGRESRSDVVYDWNRRTVDYRFRGETFFLRRVRVVHDVLPLSESVRLDDAVTAMLNYREGRWPPEPDGSFWTQMVRRKRREGEKPDDVEDRYRAEITPVILRGAVDPGSGKRTARFDLSPFSSWARPDRPATIVFGREGHPEQITMELILGTSARLVFGGAEARVGGNRA
ncbi:MAG TPA: hypothetical protein VIE41_17095 [Methylomirabilota bacterium]